MSASFVLGGDWAGGFNTAAKPTPLNETPTYYNVASLCFATPTQGSGLSTGYLCKNIAEATIKDWTKPLLANGTQVLMCLLDSETTHWWDIDPDTFAEQASQVVLSDWGITGFNFDGEGPAINALPAIIKALRAKVGPDVPIVYTCSGWPEDLAILKQIKDDIDAVEIMSYAADFSEKTQIAEGVAAIVGKEKTRLGVKCGKPDEGITPLEEVTQLTQWVVDNGYNGMMLYTTDADNSDWTGMPIWTYSETMNAILHPNVEARAEEKKFVPAEELASLVSGVMGICNRVTACMRRACCCC